MAFLELMRAEDRARRQKANAAIREQFNRCPGLTASRATPLLESSNLDRVQARNSAYTLGLRASIAMIKAESVSA